MMMMMMMMMMMLLLLLLLLLVVVVVVVVGGGGGGGDARQRTAVQARQLCHGVLLPNPGPVMMTYVGLTLKKLVWLNHKPGFPYINKIETRGTVFLDKNTLVGWSHILSVDVNQQKLITSWRTYHFLVASGEINFRATYSVESGQK